MYIWMVLTAFIVMLAAFNLSPRSDLHSKQYVPLAEASITKFLVQHDASVKYARSMLHNGTAANGTISGCNNGTGSLCKFLPVGFKYEENLYYSGLYCVNRAEYGDVYNPTTGATEKTKTKNEGESLVANCNDGTPRAAYVITYGRVPERWKNVSTNRILADYYNAMHSKIAVGSSCGIVVPKDSMSIHSGQVPIYIGGLQGEVKDIYGDNLEIQSNNNPLNSDYVINGINVQNASIPPYFLNVSEFKTKCLQNMEKFPCIIYVTAL